MLTRQWRSKMRSLKTVLVKGDDVIEVWLRLLKYCVQNKSEASFGDENNPKRIGAEICSRVVLEENAVNQLIDGAALGDDLRLPFRRGAIQKYIDEYTLEYIEEQAQLPTGHNQKFTYTYYDRFRRYPVGTEKIDQVSILRENIGRQIKSEIFSNRHQMITWIPEIDIMSSEPPCLQRVWMSRVDTRSVEAHLDWRSRDGYGAWHVNLIAIISMLYRDIALPNGVRITRVIDSCDSFHVYAGDLQKVESIV